MLNYVDNKLNVLHPATQNYSRLLWSFAFPGFLKIRGSTGTKQACHWVPTGVGEIIFAITWSHVVSAILRAGQPLNRRATGDQLVWVRRAPCLPLVSVLSHPSQPGQGQKEDSPQKLMCRAYIRSPFFSKLPFFCRLDGSCRFYLGAWVVVCIGK